MEGFVVKPFKHLILITEVIFFFPRPSVRDLKIKKSTNYELDNYLIKSHFLALHFCTNKL